MDVINAYWDQKITGIKTCEILFNKDDTFEDYLKEGIEKMFQFSVVKIPVGNLKLVHHLENVGYRYLENQLSLSFNIEQLDRISKSWYRLFRGFSYKQVIDNTQITYIINQVSDNMFNTDRYSQDPLWGKMISSKRYANWINSLFKTETVKFYIMVKSDKEVGFFAIKNETHKINSCPIAGIYNQFKFLGYIFVLVWYILEISREMGVSKFVTSVSSNNKNLLSSFSKAFNFKVNETYIVLRKTIC